MQLSDSFEQWYESALKKTDDLEDFDARSSMSMILSNLRILKNALPIPDSR